MSQSLSALQRQLLETLQTQLLPWASSGAPFVLLSPPPQVIGPNQITEYPGPALPLKTTRLGRTVRLRHWAEECLNSLTVPYLSCVVEGEADMRIGTTTAICRKLKTSGKRWVVAMPQKTFSLALPGTPFSDGQLVNWQRPHPEKAYSKILHLQIHNTGAYCHFSTSHKGKKWTHPYTFIHDTKLMPVATTLIHEMTAKSPQYVHVTYSYLTILLNYLIRDLQSFPGHHETGTSVPLSTHTVTEASLQRAVDYINENFKNPGLNAEQIANYAHVSVTHLGRLFHQEFGLPVMRFVTQKRMELGQQLLIDSNFNIKQICFHCGYLHSSSFIKVFFQHYGMSPQQYRKAKRTDG